MGYVVEDVVQRLREVRGVYAECDWERFLHDAGLAIWFCDLPVEVPAFLHDGCVYVQRGLTRAATAALVAHECGHAVMHAGGREFWMSRPQGYLTIARFERQANEFAATFFIGDE